MLQFNSIILVGHLLIFRFWVDFGYEITDESNLWKRNLQLRKRGGNWIVSKGTEL